MPANPPENMPRVTPAVFYNDPAAALQWLEKAFGFKTRLSIPGPDGGVMHAEMDVVDSVVMVGPAGGRPECKSPRSLDGSVTQSIYIYVDDVDAHYAQARDAGAEIIAELEDKFYGDRTYEARDLEGHRWSFGQHVKDVPLDQMQP